MLQLPTAVLSLVRALDRSVNSRLQRTAGFENASAKLKAYGRRQLLAVPVYHNPTKTHDLAVRRKSPTRPKQSFSLHECGGNAGLPSILQGSWSSQMRTYVFDGVF